MPKAYITNILREFDSNLGFYFSEIMKKPLAKPHWIFISLTHNCNFNCQMCGVKKILREHELDFNILKRVLEEVARWNSDCTVLFTGGEPFLRRDVFEIIEYSVSLGLKTEIVSNGSQIDSPEIARRINDSGLRNIAISLDGLNAQTHDHIRGAGGAYQKAVNALTYLFQAKRIKGFGQQISVWTTIMRENVEELCDMPFLAKNLGVECLVYHPVIVAQDDMQNTIKGGHLWITDKQIESLKQQINKIIEYQNKNGLVAFLHDPHLWLKYFEGKLTKKDWKCNPFVFVDIGPDGFVRSCGPAFGNIKEMSLTACLNTPEAKKARERMMLCEKPCLQTCWARPEADSLLDIVRSFLFQLKSLNIDGAERKRLMRAGLELLGEYEDLTRQSYS